MDSALIVLDVGKTHTKLSLMDRRGAVLARRARTNARSIIDGRLVLDSGGIEEWLRHQLREFAKLATVGTIAPVAHGATAALVDGDRLAVPVLDYETEIPPRIARDYDAVRDGFETTFSPRLPQGLNLGAQLFWQERLYPAAVACRHFAVAAILGVATLRRARGRNEQPWLPHGSLAPGGAAIFKSRATSRMGSKARSASSRKCEPLGTLRREFADATGLPRNCEVICGIHDSNAALAAARGIAGLEGAPFVLVSTGTWFVAMQSDAPNFPQLDPQRDTLANVDVEGRAVPSARFMGGREYAAIVGDAMGTLPTAADAERLIARGVMTRPSFVPGAGPFPHSKGGIDGKVESNGALAALASLHLALMTHASLDLIAATGPILIEGRFADDPVFPAALAALRPEQPVFRIDLADGVALGGARLKFPDLATQGPTERVAPLGANIQSYGLRLARPRAWRLKPARMSHCTARNQCVSLPESFLR